MFRIIDRNLKNDVTHMFNILYAICYNSRVSLYIRWNTDSFNYNIICYYSDYYMGSYTEHYVFTEDVIIIHFERFDYIITKDEIIKAINSSYDIKEFNKLLSLRKNYQLEILIEEKYRLLEEINNLIEQKNGEI